MKKFKSLFAGLVSIVLMLVGAVAFATVPTVTEIAAAKVACEKKYDVASVPVGQSKVSIALAQEKCKLEVDVVVLQAKADAAGSKNEKIEKELAQQRAALEAIAKSMKATAEASKAAAAPTPTPTAPQAHVPVAVPGPQVVQPPGRYSISPVPLKDMMRPIRIHNLGQAIHWWVGEGYEVRVEFIKNGQVLPGPAPQFELFYSANKKGPPIAHRGVDPRMVDQLFTSYMTDDDIQAVYYIWEGEYFNGTSLPVWKRKSQAKFYNFGAKFNIWNIDAISGIRIP